MPSQFTILSQQCLNKFRNDPTYSSNTGDVMRTLSAVVGERVRYKTTVEIYQFAKSDVSNVFTYETGKITRSSGSFLTDNFYVGTDMRFFGTYNVGTSFNFVFTINSISNDGRIMNITEGAGTIPTSGDPIDEQSTIEVASLNADIFAFKMQFGIIENSDNFSNLSLMNQESQEYYFGNIIDGSVNTMIASGIPNSWVDGTCTVQLLGGTVKPSYEIIHDFIINAYRDGEKSNISNGIAPLELIDGNSVKLAYNFAFGQQLNDPNSFFDETFDTQNGSVGWYGESMNGFDNDYQLESLVYTEVSSGDTVSTILSGSKTRVTATIGRVDLVAMPFSEDLTGFVFQFAASESEYTNTATDFVTNFMYSDSYQQPVSSPGFIPDNFNGVITSHIVSSIGGKVVLSVEIELTASQQLRLNSESQFLISAIVGNKSLSNGASNRVPLLLDFGTFEITDGLTGLVGIDKFNFIQIGQTYGVDNGTSLLEGWNEDPITTDIDFWLDLNLNSVLTSLSFKLVAYNSVKDEFFTLDNFTFDLSTALVVNGIQEITVNQTRNYNNAFQSQFNDCKIVTGALIGTKQHYTIQFSQRIKWQDWIINDAVDLDFFDNTKPNNNLNNKSSNYSDLQNYDIYIMASGSATGIDNNGIAGLGLFELFSQKISIFDYGRDRNTEGSEEWIETDPLKPIITYVGNPPFDTILKVSSIKDTTIVAQHTNTINVLSAGDLTGIQVLHRWQPKNSTSDDIIEQLATISLIGTTIIESTSIIPFEVINKSLEYDISTRIQRL